MIRLAICILFLPTVALAVPDLRLPGGRLVAQDESPARQVVLPSAPWTGIAPPAVAEGAVERRVWQVVDGGATPLQLLSPLRDALLEDGFDVVFDCAERTCGGYDFRFSLDLIGLPAMVVDLGNYHYLLARKGEEQVALLSSRDGARGYVHVTTLSPGAPAAASPDVAVAPDVENVTEDPTTPQVPAPASGELARVLESVGRVALDDLTFASGSTTLEAGESSDLSQLADWLAARPESRIALVGHTDAVGSLAANTRLSRARAEAVARRLVDRYGIDPARIDAEGAGYLAPRAPNTTPQGRAANRRVEAVWLDTGSL